jgi:hypothetical protein
MIVNMILWFGVGWLAASIVLMVLRRVVLTGPRFAEFWAEVDKEAKRGQP